MDTKRTQNERGTHHGPYERYVKRPMDLLLALIALIVLSPLFLIVAMLVRVRLGSPVIFRQERPGQNERIFTIYKFRTMTAQKDEDGELLPDAERLTKFGAWLRSTSVDELPELLNIIRGDMSLVGPRPLLIEYLPLYNAHQKRRHEVKPGLSGIAQINGRNAIEWEDKFDYDVQYVDNVSFTGDWKIILRTIQTVIKKDGISSENAVTMEAFSGSDKLRKMGNNNGE
jgi:undecaprenyl phosphate N,N'-diacetylbacillosamine 1-phosphate transferase